jgi:hypothetical protein
MSRNEFVARQSASSFAIAFALLSMSSSAFAQTSSEKAASAQALFDEGLRLMNAGQPASACPKFAASQKLDPGMGTKFRLAECYEKVGKTASAWALFIEIGDEARGAKRPDREKIARKRADDLAPKLARMIVLVAPDSASLVALEVRRDGIVLEKAAWDAPMPVDPGEHFLTATAPGKTAWESKPIVAQASKTVEVIIPHLVDAPNPPSRAAVVPVTSTVDEKRSVVPAVVLGGVALVAAGVGGALFAVGNGKKSDANALIDKLNTAGTHCPNLATNKAPDCVAIVTGLDAADTLHNAAIDMFIGAGAAGAAALGYFIWSRPGTKKTTGLDVKAAPVAGAGHGGIVISGAF